MVKLKDREKWKKDKDKIMDELIRKGEKYIENSVKKWEQEIRRKEPLH